MTESSDPKDHMIAVGDPVEGFQYYGPVALNDPAVEHFCEVDLGNLTWWLVPLLPVPVSELERKCERCETSLANYSGRYSMVKVCVRCAEILAFEGQNPELTRILGPEYLAEHVYQSGGWTMVLMAVPAANQSLHMLMNDEGFSIYGEEEGWVSLESGADPEVFSVWFRALAEGAICTQLPLRHQDHEAFERCPLCNTELS